MIKPNKLSFKSSVFWAFFIIQFFTISNSFAEEYRYYQHNVYNKPLFVCTSRYDTSNEKTFFSQTQIDGFGTNLIALYDPTNRNVRLINQNNEIVVNYMMSTASSTGWGIRCGITDAVQSLPINYVHTPPPVDDNYTPEQCNQFIENGNSTVYMSNPITNCYKGCLVQPKPFGGNTFTFGTATFAQYDIQPDSSCTSEDLPEKPNCVNFTDPYGNAAQICTTPPDEVDDPELPPESDPMTCLKTYDTNGNHIDTICNDNDSEGHCWFDNGKFYCTGDQYSEGFGCSQIGSYLACSAVNPETGISEPINPNSPDHPANGGNADGNPNNDLYIPDLNGQMANGGLGFGGSGTIVQDMPSASNTIQAKQISDSINSNLDKNLSGDVNPTNDIFQISEALDLPKNPDGTLMSQEIQISSQLNNIASGSFIDVNDRENLVSQAIDDTFGFMDGSCAAIEVPLTLTSQNTSGITPVFRIDCNDTALLRSFLSYLLYILLIIGAYTQFRNLVEH